MVGLSFLLRVAGDPEMEGQELRHVRSPLDRAAHPPRPDWTGLDWSGGLSSTSPGWAFGPDQPRGHL